MQCGQWWFCVCDNWIVTVTVQEGEHQFRIKRFSIFLVNQIYELEPCLAISFEITTQSGQEISLKAANLE